MEIGGLATTLSTNQRGHTLITMKLIHLKPMGHNGAQPDGQEPLLLRSDARQTVEELGDMVLSVPFGQMRQIVANGIISRHILRMHKLHNLRLRTAFLAPLLFLGPADDTVEGLLSQWTKIRLIVCRLDSTLEILC